MAHTETAGPFNETHVVASERTSRLRIWFSFGSSRSSHAADGQRNDDGPVLCLPHRLPVIVELWSCMPSARAGQSLVLLTVFLSGCLRCFRRHLLVVFQEEILLLLLFVGDILRRPWHHVVEFVPISKPIKQIQPFRHGLHDVLDIEVGISLVASGGLDDTVGKCIRACPIHGSTEQPVVPVMFCRT